MNADGGKISLLARWLAEGSPGRTVVFSGAGISTESGIPDFRSPGGLWERFDPEELSFPRFVASAQSRRRYWEFYRENWRLSREARPNPAHCAVAALEQLGRLSVVITQNIDGLHQKGGSSPEKVLELHGNMWEVRCLSCARTYPWVEIFQRLEQGGEVEDCVCGGLLKPATVSFGQSLPGEVLEEARRHSINSDLFICIGSSLVVYPAASFPQMAKHKGARLVIINREPTSLDDMADLVISGEAGPVMTAVTDLLKKIDLGLSFHGGERKDGNCPF
ncbi:MAG: Sir2 family NAD-dependent protein deacetylase [Bacillota bacterium]